MPHRGKMIDDQLAAIGRKSDVLIERLRSKYGIAREEAKRQVDDFNHVVEQLRKSMSALK